MVENMEHTYGTSHRISLMNTKMVSEVDFVFSWIFLEFNILRSGRNLIKRYTAEFQIARWDIPRHSLLSLSIDMNGMAGSPACFKIMGDAAGNLAPPANVKARRTIIPGFMCPSNPQSKIVTGAVQGYNWNDGVDGGRTDYVGSMGFSQAAHRDCPFATYTGQEWSGPQEVERTPISGNDGIFGLHGCVTIAQVTDGTSNTAMVVEDMHWGEKENPTSVQGDALWMSGYAIHSIKMAPNTDPNGDFRCDQWSSIHTGGCQMTLCDGSVRFISENVDWTIRRAVGTRSKGEVVGEY